MEIQKIIAIVMRWIWLIALGAIIAGVTSYVISINTDPVYQASTKLLIDKAPQSGGGNEYSTLLVEQRLAEKYIELIKTKPVITLALEKLEIPVSPASVNALRRSLRVSSNSGAHMLTITIEDENRGLIADLANTMALAFQEYLQELESSRYAVPMTNWESLLLQLGNDIENIENQQAAFDQEADPAGYSRLQTQLNELQIRYTQTFNELESLRVQQAQETSNLVIIEEAVTPGSHIRPRVTSNTILAIMIGAFFAAIIALASEFFDDTIRNPDQLKNSFPEQGLLGAIAFIKGDKPAQRLITQHAPRDPISEAYRIFRTNLNFSSIDNQIKTLIVTSSSPGEGKSTTAANLAIVMAQAGKSVILIDSDLRRPVQHKVFEVNNNKGLTMALLDSGTPAVKHLQQSKTPGLKLMTSGPLPPNPAELLHSNRMTTILEELGKVADYLIIDTPPVLAVTDAAILSSRTDGCIIVTALGTTELADLSRAREIILTSKGNLLGFVMNRTKQGGLIDYDYYYYQNRYYAYEYDKKPNSSKRSLLPKWLTRS